MRTRTPFTQRERGCSRFQMSTLLACMHGTVKQGNRLHLRNHLLHSLHPAPQQDDELEVPESSDDNVGSSVDLRGLNATAHPCTVIWVRIEHIQHVQQHHLCYGDPAYAAEMEDALSHHGLDYMRGLISVNSAQPVVEPFDPLDLLYCTEERQTALHDDCHVGIVDRLYCLNVLRSL